MTDLPRPHFTLLPSPAGGSDAARRRGVQRRRRQQTVAAAACLALAGSVLSAAVSPSSSAVDRLEPVPFATAPYDEPDPSPAPERSSTPEAAAAPSAEPGSSPTPAAVENGRSPSPEPEQEQEQEPAPAAQQPGPAAPPDQPVLTRAYDPPASGDATVCGGRVSSGIGAPQAQTGWCVMAAVLQSSPGGAELAVRVCRSSEGEPADLHVDAGAALMRLEQEDAVVWRLPPAKDAAAVLRVEPGGCWVWTHAWDGRGADGTPLAGGSTELHVASLADEVRDLEDEEPFTHEP